ncbi:hypothetical protein [Tistrella mobilis]|uniref:hypothetical protein n=1 Tax=Tistrella mobilis TaxID=171437 RepID=UPI003556D75B
MVPTSHLLMLTSDPTVAWALASAISAEEAAKVLGDAGEAKGFKFDWRSLIPRLRRRSDDTEIDDAALEGVAGGVAVNSAYMPLGGGWMISGN